MYGGYIIGRPAAGALLSFLGRAETASNSAYIYLFMYKDTHVYGKLKNVLGSLLIRPARWRRHFTASSRFFLFNSVNCVASFSLWKVRLDLSKPIQSEI